MLVSTASRFITPAAQLALNPADSVVFQGLARRDRDRDRTRPFLILAPEGGWLDLDTAVAQRILEEAHSGRSPTSSR